VTTTGTTYDEAWTLHREDDKRRIQILRYGNQLEYCETERDGRTTGHEGYIDAPTMQAAVLDLIRAEQQRGYRLVAHEQYDPEQLAVYLEAAHASERQLAAADRMQDLTHEILAEQPDLSDAATEAGPQRSDDDPIVAYLTMNQFASGSVVLDRAWTADREPHHLTLGDLRDLRTERDIWKQHALDLAKAHDAIDATVRRAQAAEAERDQLQRRIDAAEAAPCGHDDSTAAFDALERLHARIHRDLNFDASESAAPDDERWARVMDDLVTFADEIYMPLADATRGPGPLETVVAEAAADIELLGPKTHPDVDLILTIAKATLFAERREIALQLDREAAAFRIGSYEHVGPQQHITYDGGLRRAARVIRDRTD
jgi:hypothetical protein